MNPLAANPLAHALGWTLLHFCWQGAVVALLLWCVLGAMGTRSSQLRYAACCSALAVLVIFPLVTFVRLAVEDYRLAALARAPLQAIDIFVSASAGATAQPWPLRLSAALDGAMPWLLAVWCAGVACLFARLSLGLLAARALRNSGTAVSAELQRIFGALRARLGISHAVELLLSARVEVPTVVGWLRPVVLLPVSCLSGLAPAQIEAILCHELAHIRRHDYLISVLQSVIETLLFYHPAVWWVSRQIRRERECCCDDFAVRAGGDVLAYARALALLEEKRMPTPQFALAASGGVLKMRMQRLLGQSQSSTGSQFTSVVVLILFAASALGIAGRIAWAETRNVQPSTASSQSAGSAAVPSHASGVNSRSQALSSDPTTEAQLRADTESIAILERATDRLNAKADAFNRQQADYSALLAQAKQQPQLSEEDRRRLEDAARNLTQTIDQWTDMLHDDIQARADAMPRFTSPDFQKQMADALARANSPEFKKQLADMQAAVARLNSEDVRKQLAAAQAAMKQLNTADLQKRLQTDRAAIAGLDLDRQKQQLDAARAAFDKLNTPEFRRQMQDAAKNYARIDTPAFRKQMEDAAKKARTDSAALQLQLQQLRAFKLQPNLYARSMSPFATEVPVPDEQTPPQPSGAQRVSSGVMQSLVISQPPPVYPAEAKAAHVQGVVVLHAIISKEGTVKNLQVISGPPMLTQSAMEAVQKWIYRPYLLNGEPVEVETTINVNYTFGGDNSKPASPDIPGAPPPPPPPPPPTAGSASSDFAPATDLAGNAVHTLGAGVTPPAVIYEDDPEFTPEARAARVSGTVLVALVVNETGMPEAVHAVRSEFTGDHLKFPDDNALASGMSAKAVNAVRLYRFKPATENGEPVPVALHVEVNFKTF